MVLPLDLILVRHGESECNLAFSRAKKLNDYSCLKNVHYRKKHSSTYRLTRKGVSQSIAAGKWIKTNVGIIDKFYVSEYVRAMETAARMDIQNAKWRVSFLLRERDYQDKEHIRMTKDNIDKVMNAKLKYIENRRRDGFFYVPLQGESLAHVCQRVMMIIQELHLKCSDKRVIIVCHAETMMAFRVLLESMTMEKYKEIFKRQVNKSDPKAHVYNCQILHYTRRNPTTQKLFKHLTYMRSVCPWNEELSTNNWVKLKSITEHKHSNEELLDRINKVPLLFSNDSLFPISSDFRLDDFEIPIDFDESSGINEDEAVEEESSSPKEEK